MVVAAWVVVVVACVVVVVGLTRVVVVVGFVVDVVDGEVVVEVLGGFGVVLVAGGFDVEELAVVDVVPPPPPHSLQPWAGPADTNSETRVINPRTVARPNARLNARDTIAVPLLGRSHRYLAQSWMCPLEALLVLAADSGGTITLYSLEQYL